MQLKLSECLVGSPQRIVRQYIRLHFFISPLLSRPRWTNLQESCYTIILVLSPSLNPFLSLPSRHAVPRPRTYTSLFSLPSLTSLVHVWTKSVKPRVPSYYHPFLDVSLLIIIKKWYEYSSSFCMPSLLQLLHPLWPPGSPFVGWPLHLLPDRSSGSGLWSRKLRPLYLHFYSVYIYLEVYPSSFPFSKYLRVRLMELLHPPSRRGPYSRSPSNLYYDSWTFLSSTTDTCSFPHSQPRLKSRIQPVYLGRHRRGDNSWFYQKVSSCVQSGLA